MSDLSSCFEAKRLIDRMSRYRNFLVLFGLSILILLISVRCAELPGTFLSKPSPSKEVTITPVFLNQERAGLPDAKAVAQAYLDAWRRDEYATMYDLLTSVSKAAISEDEFTDHYQGIALVAALHDVSCEIQSVLIKPDIAQIKYRVTLSSMLVGDISRDTLMNLSLEIDQWRVQWDDMLAVSYTHLTLPTN